MNRTTRKEGMNPDEEVILTVDGASLRFSTPSGMGFPNEDWVKGEIVVTQKGIVFLEAKGIFKTGRTRTHTFRFEDIEGLRIESRGISGSLTGWVYLIVDYNSPQGLRMHKLTCKEDKANSLIYAVSEMRKSIRAPSKLEAAVLRIIKPRGEIRLQEVFGHRSLTPYIADVLGKRSDSEARKKLVRNIIYHLIAEGKLDGIVTDDGRYISNTMLARTSVQYHVTIDFNTLYGQLENKGIILTTIECPSCNGKLDYPRDGATINCQFCGSTVHATDIFERFKSLL